MMYCSSKISAGYTTGKQLWNASDSIVFADTDQKVGKEHKGLANVIIAYLPFLRHLKGLRVPKTWLFH